MDSVDRTGQLNNGELAAGLPSDGEIRLGTALYLCPL